MRFCQVCGQLQGNDDYDARLWNVYNRISDGRSYRQGLSYTGADLDDFYAGYDDDCEASEILDHVMSKDMVERGLCSGCGRPNLAGISDADILSETEAREMAEIAAEQAAEIAAGC